jgi:gas vesicle protein
MNEANDMKRERQGLGLGFGGFFLGTAVGAILGILFAPDAGTETRAWLKEAAGRSRSAVKRVPIAARAASSAATTAFTKAIDDKHTNGTL